MVEGAGPQAPEELLIELRDALSHLYDRAYLLRHPLMRYVARRSGDDAIAAVEDLRRLLCRAVEDLRPDPSTPPSDPAWRPYAVVHGRFVQGQEAATLERELSLGTRQIQREQRRGLELIALALTAREAPTDAADAEPRPGGALTQELERVATGRMPVDLTAEWARVIELAGPLAASTGTRMAEADSSRRVLVLANPEILRQLLLGATSFVLRHLRPARLAVRTANEGDRVVTRIAAGPPPAESTPPPLPEGLLALGRATEAELALERGRADVTLTLTMVAARRERIVAVVEDNQAVIALFDRYLQGRGYRLVGISDSAGAIATVRELRPDVVVLDLMMQDIDGWEILRGLKADPELSRVPVAVCSVLAEPELARLLGAAAYLVKPVRPQQLYQCLEGLLG